MTAPRVICSDAGRVERCAEPEKLHCYGAYTGTGCDSQVHFRPGRGPNYREIFCPQHGRQPWPPERRKTCVSTEVSS